MNEELAKAIREVLKTLEQVAQAIIEAFRPICETINAWQKSPYMRTLHRRALLEDKTRTRDQILQTVKRKRKQAQKASQWRRQFVTRRRK